MAITYQQAVQFMNGPVGSQIPYVSRQLRPSNWNNLNKSNRAQALGQIERAMNDPVGFSLEKLREDVSAYVAYSNIGGKTGKAEAADRKANIDKYVPFLQSQGQSVDDITSVINIGYNTGVNQVTEHFNRVNKTSTIDKVADVALGVGVGVATAGLGFSEQLIANALLQAGQGIKPADIVRNMTASIAANALTQGIPGIDASREIPKELNKLNARIVDLAPYSVQPTVISGLINAERQAVAALITKQDIVQNAIAGAAGGTIADVFGRSLQAVSPTMSKELTQALSRATAEYGQYKVAGFSDEEALQKAITGYVAQSQKIEAAAAKAEADAAKEKRDTDGLSTEQVGIAKSYSPTGQLLSGQAGQFTGTETAGKNLQTTYTDETATQPDAGNLGLLLTPSGFQGRAVSRGGQLPEKIVTKKESLPGGTTSASAEGEDLSTISSSAKTDKTAEKTPEQLRRDMILTSLINKNVSSPLYSNKTPQQAGGTGTAALAQALRVGDIGAPIFGRDEEGRRAGWNLQSLRYMGDVGAEK